MSETNMNVENSGSGIEAKITGIFDKMNSCIDKALGFITDHPWANWLKVGEKYVLRYLPFAVAFLGALTVLSTIIVACRADLGFGTVLKGLVGLVVLSAFVLYLLPKTSTLVTSLLENREDEAVRPQLLGVMKTMGFIITASLLFNPASDLAFVLVVLVVSLVLVILATNPKIMGVKAEAPKNYAEEFITLCLLPYKVFVALFTYVIAGLVIGGVVIGLTELFESEFYSIEAVATFAGTLVLTVVLPLIVYFIYLFVNFFAEIVRATVILPKKLDELRNK